MAKDDRCGDGEPFWRHLKLEEMTADQWESLCDGCGRCCLLKLEDEDTGEIHLTKLSCRLLNVGTCRCSDYENRHHRVSDCLSINPETVRALSWLPPTCGYRKVAEGRDLSWWHPLVSGDPESVHQAGISVRGWVRNEDHVSDDDWSRYVIEDFDDDDDTGPRKAG
ncbi:MAG: YcgN family cysteine cluster protein [Pseudomonadota bacterium]